MNQQSGQVRIVGHDKEKEMLARLSWLLLDAGTSALRNTFDSIHPPAVFTDRQWKLLYPMKKKHTTSRMYDSRILVVLLETICHLCPPYPHGWARDPLPKDGSLSADIVRLQLLFMDIARLEGIPGESYVPWFIQIRDVIVRLGGPPIRLKTLRETWQPDSIQRLEKVHALRSKTSKARRTYASTKGTEEGLSAEDHVVLKKTHKVLVDNVQAEDVIDRLQQSQVLKFSDRQEILTHAKRQERMQLLLDKISESKLPYSLKALFDAMKFKYKKLHDHCIAVRKQTLKLKSLKLIISLSLTDVEGITETALVNQYKVRLGRVYPFPWTDGVYGTARDVYTPLDIVDSEGHKISSTEFLPPPWKDGKGNRIVLEGESGSGKSLLCSWLAYMWATTPTYFRNTYQHVLLLNMAELEGNFETAVYRSLFPDNFKISVNEFWNMLERNAQNVLLVIDDYDRECEIDISAILSGTRLKKSTVILTARPNTKMPIGFVPDRKWFNLGFSESNIKRCFRNCVSLSQLEHDQFEKLYHLASRESWLLRSHLSNPMLAVMAFAVFSILKKGTMLRDMKTTCDLLEKYGVAMATQYCRKQKIDIVGFEFPDEVLSAIDLVDQFAFNCLMSGRQSFKEEEVVQSTGEPIVLQFGAFSRFQPGTTLRFACGISMDFLAARHIADMPYEDIETVVMKNKMFKFAKYSQSLCDQLAARNEYCIRGFYLPTPTLESPASMTSDQRPKVPRGVLEDFVTSLHVDSEFGIWPHIRFRVDSEFGIWPHIRLRFDSEFEYGPIFASALTLNLEYGPIFASALTLNLEYGPIFASALTMNLEYGPITAYALIIRPEGMIALKTLQGLCLCMDHPECTIQELELELHQYHHFQLPVFLQLAASTGECRNIRSIKITWSSLDLMAKYLAGVMGSCDHIETLYITEDPKVKFNHPVSAATWAALQSACSNMTSLQQLAFVNCHVTAVVNHVLQHIPTSIEQINFTGCAFNVMCAGQVANNLHGNTAILALDLSHTKLNSSEFVAIFQGMQMCESIRHVRVRGARLDRPCIIALAEYIKLTHSLESLDLSDCELNTEMCTQLVTAIRQNRTIQRLVFNNAKLTTEGRRVISKTKTKLKPVSVEGLLRIY
ncbi:NALP5-like protein [Mya arenaria]|uniref:NALP5-like protein n=1 Tax=Mya arenaria TaxID=6604 RepID=A0ABY7E3G7_MYAAR|nr:NALP5-like protein [Mya arenaria]